METFYNEIGNMKKLVSVLEKHYQSVGYDNVTISKSDKSYTDDLVASTIDVFVEVEHVAIIVQNTEKNNLTAYTMGRDEFVDLFSEKIWAKFRDDYNDTVCPHCQTESAHSVAGLNLSDRRVEQFFCEKCGYAWIGHPSGKFIREGTLN